MIPKIIHYCWFGNNPKSKLILRCIKSWKTLCSDYEIIEWNETNFDINQNTYVREAYLNKKWAFVSDYCRMLVLYKYGGIYLDTDVELIKPIDLFLEKGIASFEKNRMGYIVNPGVIFACRKNDKICYEILQTFEKDHFVLIDKSFNEKTICERATEIFVKHGLKINNTTQELQNYIVYKDDYFNPYDMSLNKVFMTENTVSIHWFNASWYSKSKRIRLKIYKFINSLLGFNVVENIKEKLKR